MLFERFEDEGLSQYSYAVGCPAAGEMAVVDPRRDVDVYLDFAKAKGVRITHVLETHIHADYASGAGELAQRAGAEWCVSGYDAGETFEASFPHRDLQDGEAITLGAIRIQALHTPGHTPEHVSFLVYDTHRSKKVPMLLLSGDFLFVGSLGRPDLLGEEAKRGLAEKLYDSVREALAGLPDGLEVHPGHGAGSMCGAGMSGRATSTLGFERLANPYLDPQLKRAAFIDRILGSAPPFPAYYRRMKRLNAQGAAPLNLSLAPLSVGQVEGLIQDAGAVVVDLRDQLAFGGGHIPGAFGIGAGKSLSTWASWVVPYEVPLVLVAGAPEELGPAARALGRVGLDMVRGFLDGGIASWRAAGRPLRQLAQLTPHQLHQRLQAGEALAVVDVRSDAEWAEGHIAGARHIMGGQLAERMAELPAQRPLVLACGSGYRSTVASSVLMRSGCKDLINMTGGMQAWKQAGLSLERETALAA